MNVEKNGALVITDIRVQDERNLICRALEINGDQREEYIQLKVYKTPEPPEITMTENSFFMSDDIQEVGSCKSENGYPRSVITWYKNDLPLKEDQGQISSQVIQESNGLYTIKSTLSLPIQQADNNAVFYCEVSYHLPNGDHMMESEMKNITVMYPSKNVKLYKASPPGPVKEGDNVELRCVGDGNVQPEKSYKRKDEDDILGDGSSLILENILRGSSGGYQCIAIDFNNPDIFMTAETELQVHFLDQPEFSQKSPIIVQQGNNLSVSCEANSSVETETLWKHKGRIVTVDKFLTLHEMNHGMSGKYTCTINLPSVPGLSVSKELDIIVKGKPEVFVSTQSIYVQENEMVNVTCRALGHPKPTITWSANGTTAERSEGREEVSDLMFVVTPDIMNLGVTCKAANKLGSNEETIQLIYMTTTGSRITVTSTPDTEFKREGSHGVLIVVVIICILLLAILGAVLYFLYKKGRIHCGRSGKQDITQPGEKEQIVVEMKPDSPAEESVLLPGPQDKKLPEDQGEKYMDLRN
ncbi:hypothetical protein GDO86_012797 [Hymenochirus boettgeri]|uniref:Ig-like domain-containing protein n=1 Tax=Hymenochirus boettgeri TaxID=247094 RepID=A0A8T2IU21_9PIPI|nr:hypothetical protein GDO86_012797 [Hymenochirus boettgeri]